MRRNLWMWAFRHPDPEVLVVGAGPVAEADADA